DRLAASGEEAAVRDAHLNWAACVSADLERRAETGQQWRSAFDTVADDLRAALARNPGPGNGRGRHGLARAPGHPPHAPRFMLESREHYEAAAARAPGPLHAAADLRAAADVARTAGHTPAAFDLLLAAADQGKTAGDSSARNSALAYAASIADRFAEDLPE